jgi:hypothetical protein
MFVSLAVEVEGTDGAWASQTKKWFEHTSTTATAAARARKEAIDLELPFLAKG